MSMMIEQSGRLRVGGLATAVICAVLLAIFASLSYSAARTKSATWDEPEHLLGSFLHTRYKDFRVNPEDPAFFGWIASVPLAPNEFKVDLTSESFKRIVDDTAWQWPYIWLTLYRTGGNDAQKSLNSARAAGTAVGVILGTVIAWWSYKLAGGIGAVIATTMYAFCPNFLGHASLVKNDVMLSAALTGLMFSLWRYGRRGTILRLAAVALLAGAAVSVKYSGVLCGPIVLTALVARALMRGPWIVLGHQLNTRSVRLIAAAGSCIVVGIVAWGFVWMSYGFRFSPTPDPRVMLNTSHLVEDAKRNEALSESYRDSDRTAAQAAVPEPTPEEITQRPPSALLNFVLWMESHKLLPQAWIYGFLYTYKSTLIRSSFLLGEYRVTGWWYFFPLAMLFKTPLATIVAAAVAVVVAVLWKFEPAPPGLPRFRAIDHWAFASLLTAPAIYGLSALTTNLNLGLRHVLPLYPFIFIGTAVVAAVIFRQWRWIGKSMICLLAIGLIFETLRAWPDYIAFFNTPSGGSRAGIKLLGDSNLDWGQDLKLLAKWQNEHPDVKLYLSYFGIAQPESYGIKAVHLPGGWVFAEGKLPDAPGVAAISATNLQGIYYSPELRQAYKEFSKHEPIEVLGGTIYLYPIPLPATSQNGQVQQ